jgi:hypothetical protein
MMRLLPSLVLVGAVVAGCGSSDDDSRCASGAVGTWSGTRQADSITISADGSFRYSGVGGCISSGTFACPDKTITSGTMRVSINTSSGGLCLPAGDYTCAFALNGNGMGYDCGGGSLQYQRR